MNTLSKKQLATLGQVSRRAYAHLQSVGYPLNTYDAWRREFTAEHCGGRDSWRTLFQTDYIPLLNAFAALYGGRQKADNTPKTEEEKHLHNIKQLVQYWEIPAAYIAKLVRDKARRPWVKANMTLDAMLAGMPARMMWQILITLENRFSAKMKKESEALGIPNPPRVHISRATVPPRRLAEHRGDVIDLPAPKPRTRRKKAAATPPA